MKNFYINHPYHLVDISPWPLLRGFTCIIYILSIIKWFNFRIINLFFINYIILLFIIFQWWRDIIREGTFQGKHTFIVINGLRWGIILFIISELFFFISFFWTFFHRSLSINIDIGLIWPPQNIKFFNPYQIPILNSIILLRSGISVTWAHYALLNNNYYKFNQRIIITLILGIYFTILQLFEYFDSIFCFNSRIFGNIFFIRTGFHGLHVIIGTTFLLICYIRRINNEFSYTHHFGIEAAIWYWHFVDIIWLFLYINIYWWIN